MSTKATSKKATPEAPQELYIELDNYGDVILVNATPTDAEDSRDSDNRIARYYFGSFVTVEFRAVVTDVAA